MNFSEEIIKYIALELHQQNRLPSTVQISSTRIVQSEGYSQTHRAAGIRKFGSRCDMFSRQLLSLSRLMTDKGIVYIVPANRLVQTTAPQGMYSSTLFQKTKQKTTTTTTNPALTQGQPCRMEVFILASILAHSSAVGTNCKENPCKQAAHPAEATYSTNQPCIQYQNTARQHTAARHPSLNYQSLQNNKIPRTASCVPKAAQETIPRGARRNYWPYWSQELQDL